MQLHVPFSEITGHGVRYEVPGRHWLPGEFAEHSEQADAAVRLVKKQDDKIEVQGHLQADIRLACDRCLREYGLHVSSDFTYIVEYPDPEQRWRLQDIECDSGEIDTIQVDRPVVDLQDILCQQVLLNLPVKRLCAPGCKGLCPTCGADLNVGSCTCPAGAASSPFAVLASLKKGKKNTKD